MASKDEAEIVASVGVTKKKNLILEKGGSMEEATVTVDNREGTSSFSVRFVNIFIKAYASSRETSSGSFW